MTEKEGAIYFALETEQYELSKLEEGDLDLDPTAQFHKWFEQARQAGIKIPEALTFSTAELPSGRVSSRIVLMKELDKDGSFVIYSNWKTSRKAKDFETNPYVSINFFWKELERQVRIEGIASRISQQESQLYFDTRPRESRLGAWASPQSTEINDSSELEAKVKEQEERFKGIDKIPCPPYWGGIRIKPFQWEFFQGRKNRLHDRFVYSESGNTWNVKRISP